jgi:hypothetical protein
MTHRLILCTLVAVLAAACSKQPTPAPQTPGTAGAHQRDEHDCDDHESAGSSAHAMIPLGSGTAGSFSVRAAREEGRIKAGCDAPVDVWVDGGPRVVAVRFWIGLKDGRASIKAKAEIEDPAEPNRWHNHVEIPDPIPEGSKLWVEIEAEGGTTSVTSFDLKP